MNATLPIHSLSGTVVATAIVTEPAVSHEELMTADYVQLSWNSNEGDTLPAGAYITVGGEKYSLLDPYTPTRANEAEYQYTPQFQSRIMAWQKHIVPLYTYDTDGTTVKTRELDWNFTGSPADAMYMVQQAIKNETGEQWTVQLADSLPATITVSSQSGSIFSLLSDIAGQCETEWWADKATNTLYLSRCQRGTAIALTVGDNVGVPSVTASQDGYYTRFYVFGSTRNVTQDSGASVANSVVNKRLTLDPATYPGGYIDVRPNLQEGEIFTKTLYYDDIYPSSKLTISDVRARLKYRLDSNGNKIEAGTDDSGQPIYEQYTIWYFKIAGFDFDPTTIIPQTNLSVHFEDGQLAGRDFELTYHDKADNTHYTDDALPFVVEAGDYEITIDESGGTIIPGLAYIIPQDGDKVILYNIVMPAEYTASAQQELAERAQKDIAKMTADNNSYEMDSYPTEFEADDTDLTLGQAVTYTNGDTVLSTRVLMVEKHLDANCQQRIRVGNALIKGNTQQLREEMTQATQNIDILAAFNNLSASVSNAYAKVQREMLEGFARIGDMWKFDPDDPTVIYSKYSAYVNGFLSAKGKNPESGSEPGGATTLAALTDVSITTTPKDGQVLAYDATLNKWTPVDMEATAGIDEEELLQILTQKGYATQQWVTQQSYAKTSVRIKAGTGLTGGGTLAQDVTLSLATVGTAGTYTKVTVDSYGRVTGHASLTQGDIPALAISKITGLQTALDAKLNKSVFEELFEKVWVSGYGYAIRAKLAFYSDDWISAKGLNSDAGSTTGGVDENEVLQIVENAGYIKESALNGYATQSWVRGLGYMSQGTADGRYFRTNISTLPDDDLSSIPTGSSGSYIVPYPNWNGSAFVFLAGSSNSNIGFLYKGGQAAASAKINLIATNDSNPSAWADLGALVTSGNYTDYTVTKTGGGASGTWGIGITGNAGTATRLATARTLWGQPFNGTGNVDGTLTVNGGIKLTGNVIADGILDSLNFVQGKTLSSAPTNFQQDVFGTTAWGYKLTAIRWDGTDSTYGARWSPMIAVATNDTSGFITLSSSSADTCYIGGGGSSSLVWQAKLFNDSMNLIPKNNTYSIGSASVRWYEIYASRFIANGFLQVGNGRIYYDSSNNALFVENADGTACGFYATGFMSAKGLNSDAGSAVAGATTLNGLSYVTISSPSNGQSLVYRNGVWKNEMVSGGGSSSVAWADITGKPSWIPDTDGSGSGIDADLLDGTHKTGLFTAMTYRGSTLSITIGGMTRTATIQAGGDGVSSVSVSSSSSRNLSVTVDGVTDYVNDLYATYSTYADYLRTSRTIWGQSFNGGSSISGNMTGVGILYFSNNVNIRAINSSTAGIYASNDAGGLKVKSLYIGTTYTGGADDGLLVVSNNGNAVTIGSQNSSFCHVYNSKSIPFIFNNTVATTAGDLGTSTYRWGTVYAKNALNASSDLRLKQVLEDIPLTIAAVAAAPSFLYRWKNGADTALHAGSSAQYWQQALPQAVTKGEDGYLAMEYDRIALAAAIATARAVETLDQRVARLEKENKKLRFRIKMLEKR